MDIRGSTDYAMLGKETRSNYIKMYFKKITKRILQVFLNDLPFNGDFLKISVICRRIKDFYFLWALLFLYIIWTGFCTPTWQNLYSIECVCTLLKHTLPFCKMTILNRNSSSIFYFKCKFEINVYFKKYTFSIK